MVRKICCIILAAALPALLEAVNGCALDRSGLACEGDCLKPAEKSNVNSYICSCTCTNPMHNRQIAVNGSADDAQEFTNGAVDVAGLALEIGQSQVRRVVGVRFDNVGIPPGSTILDAQIRFTASATNAEVMTYVIVGQDADDAAPFAVTLQDLTARPVTMSSVAWLPPSWSVDDSGADQTTPDVGAIVQEIIDRPGWASGNAMVFLVEPATGDGFRIAYSYDAKPLSAPFISINYTEPSAPPIGPQDLPVCMLPSQNANIGGTEPDDATLNGDCQGRVKGTFTGLAAFCGYPSDCQCQGKAGSKVFSDACDKSCVENTVNDDCSNFDPVHEVITATNAPFEQPVCLANSPLSSGIYGRRTMCEVAGVATLQIDDESASPAASGVLLFDGDACPGGGCAVGMEYRIDVGSITFSNILGSSTFDQLAGLGENVAGQKALLDASGAGAFTANEILVSARGRRDGEQAALFSSNQETLNVDVDFGAVGPTCALSGALVGSLDPEIKRCEDGGNLCDSDSDCGEDDSCEEVDSTPLVLSLNLGGTIKNQPPDADAGDDQTVECPADPVLNASGSSDLDSNIVLFSWRLGTRTGPEVGFEEMATVQQGLGTLTYVLRVIDSFGQADEDSTDATVVDTTPPQLSCSVTVPVLQQTNHNMVNVGLASRARDACEGELPVTISVFGDEDDEMQTGDGHFSPDAKNIDIGSLRLRAERQGNGDGRVYLILSEATDSSGNRGINCCTVVVPHSANATALQSVLQQAQAAQAFCIANDGAAPAGFFVIGDGPVVGPKQ